MPVSSNLVTSFYLSNTAQKFSNLHRWYRNGDQSRSNVAAILRPVQKTIQEFSASMNEQQTSHTWFVDNVDCEALLCFFDGARSPTIATCCFSNLFTCSLLRYENPMRNVGADDDGSSFFSCGRCKRVAASVLPFLCRPYGNVCSSALLLHK